MRKFDPEKLVKDKLRRHEVTGSACNVIPIPIDTAQALMDRLQDYRNRIKSQHTKFDAKSRALVKENSEMKRLLALARGRLDPEAVGTMYSVMDQYEIAGLIDLIEKKRGAIVAQRVLYGQPADKANETEGVLRAAVEAAKAAEDRWRGYLAGRLELSAVPAGPREEKRVADDCRRSIWQKLWSAVSGRV